MFFQILEVLDVKLKLVDSTALASRFEKNGYIPFMEALRYLSLSHISGDWELKKVLQGGLPRGVSIEQPVRRPRNTGLMHQTVAVEDDEDAKSIT